MTKLYAVRKHEIHAGHRVFGHHGKCSNLHGHSYIIHFYCEASTLDNLGMVIDFGIIKSTLCKWLEDNYDHKLLIWEHDPIADKIKAIDPTTTIISYNPTAENLALHLINEVAPKLLGNTGIKVTKIIVEETSKCKAICEI